MGEIRPTALVLPILAAFSPSRDALDWAGQTIEETWGPIVRQSPLFDFTETDYYESEMGLGLKKTFFIPARLNDPGKLPDWKRATNAAERAYAEASKTKIPRPLNLDPGYLTESKLVLASTKDHAHRIYLGQGIFAEITLKFAGKRWQPWKWTYPDYRRADYHVFFDEARRYLRSQNISAPTAGDDEEA